MTRERDADATNPDSIGRFAPIQPLRNFALAVGAAESLHFPLERFPVDAVFFVLGPVARF